MINEIGEMCMLCLDEGPVNFSCECGRNDAHLPVANSAQDANGETLRGPEVAATNDPTLCHCGFPEDEHRFACLDPEVPADEGTLREEIARIVSEPNGYHRYERHYEMADSILALFATELQKARAEVIDYWHLNFAARAEHVEAARKHFTSGAS